MKGFGPLQILTTAYRSIGVDKLFQLRVCQLVRGCDEKRVKHWSQSI